METDKIMVSISTITFNHAKYIRQCLDGMLAQECDFRFEILIHDDASTDGTEEIIREYEEKHPDIIRPLYEKENQWVKGRRGSAVFNFPRAKGKYIALCEGDDYWIDPLKLQKQVDFLEANEDYGLVHTDFLKYIQKEDQFEGLVIERHVGDIFEYLIKGNEIGTLTALFRATLLNSYPIDAIDKEGFKMGDYPLWLHIAKHSKIGYLNDVTSVYRMLEESASHFKSRYKSLLFEQSVWKIRYFFCEKGSLKEDLGKQEKGYYREQMYVALFLNDRKLAEVVYAFWKDKKQLTLRRVLCYCGVRYSFVRPLVLRKFAKQRQQMAWMLDADSRPH